MRARGRRRWGAGVDGVRRCMDEGKVGEDAKGADACGNAVVDGMGDVDANKWYGRGRASRKRIVWREPSR